MTAAKLDTTILCVGNDPRWQEQIAEALADPHLRARQAEAAERCLRAVQGAAPHLVILDRILPDVSGLGLCRILRERPEADEGPRIIMVSARAAEIDRVLACEAAVDDFLWYPSYARELRSRVQAVLRRSAGRVSTEAKPDVIRLGRLEVDENNGQVFLDRNRVRLTPREFAVLSVLLDHGDHRDRVLSRREILDLLCRDENHGIADRAIDAYVKAIRRKLGPAGSAIETVRGVGYRLSASEPSGALG